MRDIERQLQHLPKPSLSRARDAQIRAAIVAYDVTRVSAEARESSRRGGIGWWKLRPLPQFAFVTAAVLVAVVGVSGYAYASPNVARGDTLYGVKRTMERMHGSWQHTPLQLVAFHSNLALRRSAELEVLIVDRGGSIDVGIIPAARAAADDAPDDDPVRITAHEVVEESDRAVEAAERIDDPDVATRALAVLRERQPIVLTRLERTVHHAQRRANVRAVRALTTATDAVTAASTAVEAASRDVRMQRERGERRVKFYLRKVPPPLIDGTAVEPFAAPRSPGIPSDAMPSTPPVRIPVERAGQRAHERGGDDAPPIPKQPRSTAEPRTAVDRDARERREQQPKARDLQRPTLRVPSARERDGSDDMR